MGGLLGKVQAERCHGGDCPSDIVLKHELAKTSCACRLATGGCLCGCISFPTAWSQDVTHLRMAFPQENEGHGYNCLFWFWFQILLLYGGQPQRSPVWILREGEMPVLGRSCTSTTSAVDHHTQLRHSLGEIAHLKPFKPKKKNRSHGLTMPQQHLH